MNLEVKYQAKDLAQIAAHLRKRATEIKAVSKKKKIDQARQDGEVAAYEDIAQILDRTTIVQGT